MPRYQRLSPGINQFSDAQYLRPIDRCRSTAGSLCCPGARKRRQSHAWPARRRTQATFHQIGSLHGSRESPAALMLLSVVGEQHCWQNRLRWVNHTGKSMRHSCEPIVHSSRLQNARGLACLRRDCGYEGVAKKSGWATCGLGNPHGTHLLRSSDRSGDQRGRARVGAGPRWPRRRGWSRRTGLMRGPGRPSRTRRAMGTRARSRTRPGRRPASTARRCSSTGPTRSSRSPTRPRCSSRAG